jgi:hypothetical protein
MSLRYHHASKRVKHYVEERTRTSIPFVKTTTTMMMRTHKEMTIEKKLASTNANSCVPDSCVYTYVCVCVDVFSLPYLSSKNGHIKVIIDSMIISYHNIEFLSLFYLDKSVSFSSKQSLENKIMLVNNSKNRLACNIIFKRMYLLKRSASSIIDASVNRAKQEEKRGLFIKDIYIYLTDYLTITTTVTLRGCINVISNNKKRIRPTREICENTTKNV